MYISWISTQNDNYTTMRIWICICVLEQEEDGDDSKPTERDVSGICEIIAESGRLVV